VSYGTAPPRFVAMIGDHHSSVKGQPVGGIRMREKEPLEDRQLSFRKCFVYKMLDLAAGVAGILP
jgi:hypothetical protein